MADTNPVETTETPPPAETPAVETPPEQPTLSPRLQKAAEFGFENLTDEGEAFDRLLAYTQNLKNEFGSQLQSAIEQVKQTPQPTTAQAHDAQQPDHWWNPPKVDTTLVAKYRQADGSWKPETPTDIRQQGDAAQTYYDKWANDLVHRPHEVLPKLIREEAERIVAEKFGQSQQQQQLSQFQQRIFTENTWLFEPDPISGRPSRNLSPEGQLIDRYMQEAQQRGADYEFAWDYAITKHTAAKASAQAKQATQAQSAAEINEQKKADLLRRVAPGANRTGSMPLPSDTRLSQKNKNLSLGERALQIHNRNGAAV